MELLPQLKVDLLTDMPEPLVEELELDSDEEDQSSTPKARSQNKIMPLVSVKEAIPEEDIFVQKPKRKAKVKAPVEEEEEESGGANFVYEPEPEPEPEPLKVKPVKTKKPRKPMSETQLANLKKGREKALATRRANAAERKEVKELNQKKKKKDIQKLREEVSDEPVQEKTPPRKIISSLEDLPEEVIRQLQEKAIEGYEVKRKARKQVKRESLAKEGANEQFLHMVQNSAKPTTIRYGEAGFFSHLF
tara:strand:- start:82 stop:825 length:744 start_codon:yes stop_codon:yes gene_type:complete